ncbi:hypothetical protein CDAR_587361 [Caerostris darwini]|uniref:Uncharacterized protein n=1 Tax=Caerostris darwini TaxID=1538125 RepID=A0AAV4SH78_9ARAC|nr:hypothetical protein CDAR_587361 [Caerostris darwini]
MELVLGTYDLFSKEQAGFRRNTSTEDEGTHLSQFIKDSIDEKKVMTILYIHFKSDYNSVWKEKNIQNLKESEVEGNMLKWFILFLCQRSCKVPFGNSNLQKLQSSYLQARLSQGCSC